MTTPRSTEWYHKNKDKPGFREKRNKYSLEYGHKNQAAALYRGAKFRATRLGRLFTIEKKDVIIPDVCPILKVPMVKGTRLAPSLDRIDSSGDYTPGNVWVISRRANLMKNDASVSELIEFGKWALEAHATDT